MVDFAGPTFTASLDLRDLVPDTADASGLPDVETMNGRVTFTPSLEWVAHGGQVIHLRPLSYDVVAGVMQTPSGETAVPLPASDPSVTVSGAQATLAWVVQLTTTGPAGKDWPTAPPFAIQGDTSDTLNLADHWPAVRSDAHGRRASLIVPPPWQSVQEIIDSLPNGVVGKSAYESAVDAGYVGSEADWVASLEGPTGPTGPAGADGVDGVDGTADDSDVAPLITNPASSTRAALDDVYRPAARSPITGWFHADRYGSGTVTAASVQAAVDAARQSQAQTGQGGTVYIPDPPPGQSWVMSAPINLYSRVTIKGNNRTKTAVKSGASIDQSSSFPVLQGPGGGVPVFQIGQSYPVGADSLGASDTVLDGISAHNNEAPVVRNWAGLNFRIVGCDLRSFYAAEDATNGIRATASATPIQSTIELRYAYRGVIEQSTLGCQRGWVIDARDNINGVAIRDNVISGGSLGGAISLNLVTAVTIENNVIETSRDGIRLGVAGYPPYSSGDPTLYRHPAGRCHNVHIRGNYLETCARYISMPYQEANGVVIEGNYLGGGSDRSITPEYGILAGRLNGCAIKSNSWHSVGSEPFLKVQYVTGGTVNAPINCEIGPNHFNPLSGTPVVYDLSAYPNVIQRSRFAGRNTVWTAQPTTDSVPKVTGQREWTSGTLAANATSPIFALMSAEMAGWGAGLVTIEIIAATGTLTGAKVQLGSPVSATEFADVAIDGLTYTYGAAAVDLSTVFTRADTAQPLIVRSIAGTGTGSFQVRVKWRGL